MAASLENIRRFVRQGPPFIDMTNGRNRKKTSPQIAVRFDEATMREIKRRAGAEKLPAAKIIRRLIAQSLSVD